MTADTQQAQAPPARVPVGFTTRIVLVGGGRFIHDPAGELAQIAGLRDRFDAIEDLVGWFPDTPGRWYLREGLSPILGARGLALAASFGDAIAIHPTPAAWVAAGGEGGILDWRCSLAGCFEGVTAITTGHLEPGVAREIEKRLKRNFWRCLPRIGGRRGR